MEMMAVAKMKVVAVVGVGVMALVGVLAVAQTQGGGSKTAAGGPAAGQAPPGAPGPQLQATTNPVLDGILKQLSQHEQRLSNLKIVAEFNHRRIADNQVATLGTGTAWIIPVAGSKIRFDMDYRVSVTGPHKQTNSYDGRARYDFRQEESGHPDGVLKRDRLAVVDAPNFGWNASTYGCFDYQGKTLTQFIGENRQFVTISQDREDGKEYVVVTIAYGEDRKLWALWLDRDRACAVKRIIQYGARRTPEGKLEDCVTDVKEMQEVAPNAYYPSHVVWTVNGYQMEYRATSIVANDPTFNDAVFTFQWPAGTVVRDELTNAVVVVGKDSATTKPVSERK
jgi:hypothetical protein